MGTVIVSTDGCRKTNRPTGVMVAGAGLVLNARTQFDSVVGRLRRLNVTFKEHLDKALEVASNEKASLLDEITNLQGELAYAKSQVETMKSELASERKKCLAYATNLAEIHEALDSACVGRSSFLAVARIDILRKQRDAAWDELRDTRKSNADMYAELEKARKSDTGETELLVRVHQALTKAGAPIWPDGTVQDRISMLGHERDNAATALRAVTTQRDMARNALNEYKEAVKNAMAFLEEVNEGH